MQVKFLKESESGPVMVELTVDDQNTIKREATDEDKKKYKSIWQASEFYEKPKKSSSSKKEKK